MNSWNALLPEAEQTADMRSPARLAHCATVEPSSRPIEDAEDDENGEMDGGTEQPQGLFIPYVTYALLLVNALVFAAMWKLGNGNVSLVETLFGSKDNALIQAGQRWRFVTPIFLHGNLLHLLVNSLSLYVLGTQMEQLYGARKYFLIYMTAGVAGYVASYYGAPEAHSVGASGAIFGLVGAGLMFPLRYRSLVPRRARSQILTQLLIVALVNLGIGLYKALHIDNYAHMGGLIGGAFAALFLIPEVLEEERPALLNRLTVNLASLVALGVIGWAGMSQWRIIHMIQSMEANVPPLSAFTIFPKEADPWWSIGILKTWKPKDGGWQSPQGAMVYMIDSARDPQTVVELGQAARAAGKNVQFLPVDGKPAVHLTRNTPKGWLEFTLIQPCQLEDKSRMVALLLQCPAQAFAQAHNDYLQMLMHIRFVHSPEERATVSGN